ncbi:adenylyl-sulfate kinase [Streptomyces luomodiensis]|uniref:Adenylyl-sulfate kinase n=1 Tax=Streptomyces luomodiensis TaxID=3026192 RepID=A0ABY9V4M0_9ACTN|nr:adenylyl-sulfate kinase [Streptomyces sp. SCA4-21]WNE99748.1 adenylyl-sulfate kinase [Streptomyces sp. SCA4-21]
MTDLASQGATAPLTDSDAAGPRTRRDKPEATPATGFTVWLTGLPSAGKTTIATALAGLLRATGRRVQVLDGDEVRATGSLGLGFSRADRETHVRRVGYAAQRMAARGACVLVPVIAPYAGSRAAVRTRHEAEATPYVEVHVATPVEVCSRRDVKGLYAQQAAGEPTGLTGVDDPYEPPESPDLRLDTRDSTVSACAGRLYAHLMERGLV